MSIQHIQWLEDDSGFVSCGSDKRLNFWNLYKRYGDMRKDYAPEPKWDYQTNKVLFTSTFVYKDEATQTHTVYATCSDKSIRELIDPNPENKDPQILSGKPGIRYEECIQYSQIVVGPQRKMIAAAVREEDKPGSI